MYKIIFIANVLFYRTYFKFLFIVLSYLFAQKSFSQIITTNPKVEKDRSVISNHNYAQRVTVIACDVPTTFNCDPNNANSAIIMDTQPNKEFTFDNFSKYNGGLTLNGSTILKLKVAASTSTLSTGPCQWKLVMIVSNGGSPTVSTDWETLSSYGSSSATKPSIDNLFVRVSNGCNTPQNSGVWQQFNPADGDVIEIINPVTITGFGAGSACSGGQTNGAGTYLGADYNEYSFTIDYRLNPGFLYQPGRYEIFIKFCLVEK
jgi:hypothetical protein